VSGGKYRQVYLSSSEYYVPLLIEWIFGSSTHNSKDSNTLVACDGVLYDIGGWTGAVGLSAVERLCGLQEQWEVMKSMHTPRLGHAAISHDGYIYAIGGQTGPTCDFTTKSIEKYDPLTDRWAYVKNMNFARAGHFACLLQNKVYVVDGNNEQDECVREIECYDSTNNIWVVVGNTPVDLYNHSLIAI